MARLVQELLVLAPLDGPLQASEVEKAELTAAAVADAWTFVDAAYRFKRFFYDRPLPRVSGMPTGEMKPEYQISGKRLKAAVDGLKDLRDKFQHLDVYAPKQGDADEPVWGDLSWLLYDPSTGHFYSSVLVTSSPTAEGMSHNFINPLGKPIQSSPDLITLTAFGQEVNLCEIHRAMAEVVAEIGRVATLQFEGLPVNDSTMVLTLKMEPITE
jgi:hypothetical protein